MTLGGWINMSLSVGSVVTLFIWCIYRVLAYKPPAEHMHGFDIDTKDQDTD